MKTPAQLAYDEIMEHFASFSMWRHRLQSASIQPSGVVIPARLNVPYDGDDATDAGATLMGLPVIWSEGEHWGLVVAP